MHNTLRPAKAVIVILPAVLTMLFGCATGPSHADLRAQAEQVRLQKIDSYQNQISGRRAAGENVDIHPLDQGYALLSCGLGTASAAVEQGLIVGAGVGRAYCQNTELGSAIVERRRFLCGELTSYRCVCGEWREAKPTFFSPVPGMADDFTVFRVDNYSFTPCRPN